MKKELRNGGAGEAQPAIQARASGGRFPAPPGQRPLSASEKGEKRLIVYFNAAVKLLKAYDFSDWEGLSPASLANVLGATEKGLSGIKPQESRQGDLIGPMEAPPIRGPETSGAWSSDGRGEKRQPPQETRHRQRGPNSSSPSCPPCGPSPARIAPRGFEVIDEELERAIKAIQVSDRNGGSMPTPLPAAPMAASTMPLRRPWRQASVIGFEGEAANHGNPGKLGECPPHRPQGSRLRLDPERCGGHGRSRRRALCQRGFDVAPSPGEPVSGARSDRRFIWLSDSIGLPTCAGKRLIWECPIPVPAITPQSPGRLWAWGQGPGRGAGKRGWRRPRATWPRAESTPSS